MVSGLRARACGPVHRRRPACRAFVFEPIRPYVPPAAGKRHRAVNDAQRARITPQSLGRGAAGGDGVASRDLFSCEPFIESPFVWGRCLYDAGNAHNLPSHMPVSAQHAQRVFTIADLVDPFSSGCDDEADQRPAPVVLSAVRTVVRVIALGDTIIERVGEIQRAVAGERHASRSDHERFWVVAPPDLVGGFRAL